jgi:hypothetical protein
MLAGGRRPCSFSAAGSPAEASSPACARRTTSGYVGRSSPSRRRQLRSARPPSPPRCTFLLAPRPSSPHVDVDELEWIRRQSPSLAPVPPSSRGCIAPQLGPPPVTRRSIHRPPPQLYPRLPFFLPQAGRPIVTALPLARWRDDGRETPRRAMARLATTPPQAGAPTVYWCRISRRSLPSFPSSHSQTAPLSRKEKGEDMMGPAKHVDARCRESPALAAISSLSSFLYPTWELVERLTAPTTAAPTTAAPTPGALTLDMLPFT